MMKHLLSSVAIVAMTVAASAADLPRRAPPPYIPPPPPPMWTGPFVGVHLGFGWGDPSNDPDDKVLISGPSFNNNYGGVAIGSRDRGSLTGGAQLGYNLQLTPTFLVGAVADFTWLGRDYSAFGSTTSAPNGFGWTETATYTSSLNHDWLGTVRLRAGVTIDNLLLYATGGLAFGDIDSRSTSLTTTLVPGNAPTIAATGTGGSSGVEFGWTIGAGLEYRLSPSWSLFAEYLYYSLSSRYTVNVTPGPLVAALPTSYRVKADADGHLVKVGINYAFWSY